LNLVASLAGATKGIGRQIATQLAEAGYKVAFLRMNTTWQVTSRHKSINDLGISMLIDSAHLQVVASGRNTKELDELTKATGCIGIPCALENSDDVLAFYGCAPVYDAIQQSPTYSFFDLHFCSLFIAKRTTWLSLSGHSKAISMNCDSVRSKAREALGGRIDVLVNNAGYSNANQKIKVKDETVENFDTQIAINVCAYKAYNTYIAESTLIYNT
jgi:NAD(P)-dependent dehydrogenase (short-subunit alcohol dehydrogenase family)